MYDSMSLALATIVCLWVFRKSKLQIAAAAAPLVNIIIGYGCSICMKKNYSALKPLAKVEQMLIALAAISSGNISVFPVKTVPKVHVVPSFEMKNKIGKMKES